MFKHLVIMSLFVCSSGAMAPMVSAQARQRAPRPSAAPPARKPVPAAPVVAPRRTDVDTATIRAAGAQPVAAGVAPSVTPAVVPPRATASRAMQLSVSGSGVLPLGLLGTLINPGVEVRANADLQPSALPFGVRADAGLSWFAGRDGGPSLKMVTIGADASVTLPTASAAQPARGYLLAGLGLYTANAGETSSDLGFRFGGGFRLRARSLATSVEAKVHFVNSARWMTVGAAIPLAR